MARLSLLIAAIVTVSVLGCRDLANIADDKSQCTPRCLDDQTAVTCSPEGVATRVACPSSGDPCLKGCTAGECALGVREGNTCGDDAAGTCNAAGVCMGPSMSLGGRFQNSCAVVHDGSVWCWGANDSGQIGDGTTSQRPNPTRVRGMPHARSVAVGYRHACAIARDGDVWCWGSNVFGQLGNGRNGDEAVPVPQKVENLHAPSALSLGEAHSCALMDDGAVYCWGSNAFMQLGMSTGTLSPTPVKVALGLTDQISTAKRHTCAKLRDDPYLVCWGWNLQHQLGPAAGDAAQKAEPVPITLPNGVHATAVTVLHRSTCALGNDQFVYCWGLNEAGELGDGTTTGSVTVDRGDHKSFQPAEPTPQVVIHLDGDKRPLSDVLEMTSTDGSHVIVRTNDRTAPFFAWGKDDRGELGRGELKVPEEVFPGAIPVKVLPIYAHGLASGEDHVCAIYTPPALAGQSAAPPSIWCYGSSWGNGSGTPGTEDPVTAQPVPAEVKWLPSPP